MHTGSLVPASSAQASPRRGFSPAYLIAAILTRRRAVAAAVLLLLAPALAAQERGTVSGRVATPDGEPASDAVVMIVATRAREPVDDGGRFLFRDVPVGTQLLEVSSPRHGRGVGRVTVAAGETAEVEILLERRIHTERIVVTAGAAARPQLDLATPVHVLDGQELSLRAEPSIGETLSKEVGIASTSFAPGASRPVIRGLSGDRVRMLDGGIGTGDVSSTSPDHAVGVDPLSTERVEVVRGPATLLYGGNAIGGVVNMLDRRIPDYKPTESFSGAVDLRGGSVADERSAGVSLDGGGGRWAWHLDSLTRKTGDFDIPGRASLEANGHQQGARGEGEREAEAASGTLPNSDIRTASGAVGASYFFGEQGFLGVSVRGFDNEYGVPGEPGEGIRIDMKQRRYDLEAAITQPFGAFQGVKLRLGVVDYEHDELEGPGNVGTSFFNDGWEGRVELIQKAKRSHSGSFGLQLGRRELEAVGDEAFLPPTESENLGVFTFQELGGGAVRYQLGVRREVQSTTVRDPQLPDRDFDGLSASVGVVWQPSESYSLGTSLARSVKMPNSEELYSNGLHFATSAFELGDPSLEEESALGLELFLRKVEGRLTGAVNLFYSDFSDFIFQRVTGQEVEGLPVLRYSQANAEFRGAELDLTIALVQQPHSSWDLDLTYDLVRAALDGGSDVPRIPPQRLGVGAHYRGDRLRGGAEVRYVAEQTRVAENETPTDGYTVVNANISYRFFFSERFLDLMLRGTNLTDEEARNHVSFVKDDVPLPGRDVSLITRFAF